MIDLSQAGIDMRIVETLYNNMMNGVSGYHCLATIEENRIHHAY